MNDIILQWILGIAATLITTACSVLIPMLVKYLGAKTNNENLQSVLSDLGETVETSVGYIAQRIVDQAKKDGTWNSSMQKIVLDEGIREVMNSLSKKTIAFVEKDGLDLKHIIERRIEDEISKRKTTPATTTRKRTTKTSE